MAKNIFSKGDIKTFQKVVASIEIAAFENGIVHPVYSTFSLAKDAEWCGRLFVLDMLEDLEEGIGTQITVKHISPAFVGDTVTFITTFDGITDKGEILTGYEAFVNKRLIAAGIQGQKILLKSQINKIFDALR
jgi:fluoroacetyl-CoA thioesterase